eukprot:TRINITY_DN5058_c0_g1_i1.p1 TRINITY_DN5058_c0_g1~~TRINITY_DN5058_c0_g1_i1.p1  ORF type:complete len:413 (+),score=64.82 TRINITY_DN5058_c0_g1_i1:55-1239(+)
MQSQQSSVDSSWSMAEAACQLKNSISGLKDSYRPLLLSRADYPFEGITAEALQSIIRDAKDIQQYAQQCLEELTMTLAPRSLDGTCHPVQIRPAVDSVAELQSRVWKEHNTKHCNMKFTVEQGMVVMERQDLLLNYDLSSPVLMVVMNDPVGEQLIRMPFDNPSDFGYDMVSGTSAEFVNRLNDADATAVSSDGRSGLKLLNRCVLQLPVPVTLEGAWTVSVWTLAPDVNERRGYRVLLDGAVLETMILLTLNGDSIGNYFSRHNSFQRANRLPEDDDDYSDDDDDDDDDASDDAREDYQPPGRTRPKPFKLGDLADGWHHMAAVGAEGRVSYYVDGLWVGSTPCPVMSGDVCYVGNSAMGRNSESFGVMSDFRIFASAASAQQVMALASEARL